MRRISRWLMFSFYMLAGLNHFMDTNFYLALIPDYIPFPVFINYFVGFLELLFASLLMFGSTRKVAVFGILFLLLLLIPSHVYFIQKGSCVANSLCVDEWIAWVRLLLGQPLLMWWAWSLR